MGHTAILDHLFNRKKGDFDVNWIDEAKRNALHWAASSPEGDVDRSKLQAQCATMLCKNGCVFDHQDFRGRTPLMVAIFSGNAEVCKQLLHERASLTLQDRAHMTACDYAVNSGHAQIIELMRGSMLPEQLALASAPPSQAKGPVPVCTAPPLGRGKQDTGTSSKARHLRAETAGTKKEKKPKDSSRGAITKEKARTSPEKASDNDKAGIGSQRAPKTLDF